MSKTNMSARCMTLSRYCAVKIIGALVCALSAYTSAEPHQVPLFLVNPVKPITMLNMSRDHQLYFKLYDDFSDITDGRLTVGGQPNSNYGKDPDGLPDTGYVHGFDYYGYFDSYKCYTYSTTNNRFEPAAFTTNKYCNVPPATGQWSGNFLNWASMTRMDAIRKILYGGMRSTDTTSLTVLERAYLPTDAHSFAKYYAGADIPKLTPFTSNIAAASPLERGITICNTSDPGTATHSQSATAAAGARPLLRVARGNYSLWASNERWQCRWEATITDHVTFGVNGNDPALSGIQAYGDSPINAHRLGSGFAAGEFVARVAVCVNGLLALDSTKNNEKCRSYNSSTAQKPTGLLQEYAGTQHFGLLTGSYGRNLSGGVLRKAVGTITDEINANGIFQVPASGNSIIRTLDLLRIYGYRYGNNNGLYHDNNHVLNTPGPTANDGCKWATAAFLNGQCSNWGNPQAEIYLESLRYLSGATSPQFDTNDAAYIANLNRVTSWVDPISTAPNGNYCAPLNIVQFDASMASFDADNLTNAPSTITNINAATDIIGAAEGIHGSNRFVGNNGALNNSLCTPKNITSLAAVRGACPDAPRLNGSYLIAGLAYRARTDGIGAQREKVRTYGVALAASVPNVVVPVPGSTTNAKVTILPACRNTDINPNANCAIVDFKIVEQNFTASSNTGTLYVNWEDTEHGGDYDQDMWGILRYTVTPTTVSVTTHVIAVSSPNTPMGFGYVISGTTNDGFHVHSGVHGFVGDGCAPCNLNNPGATVRNFTIGSSNVSLLEPPLYYAAKWGGYDDDALTPTEIANLTEVGSYFKATDPRRLEAELARFFDTFAASGSSATVAANSTRLEDETKVYQAKFNSDGWTGSIEAFPFTSAGVIDQGNKIWSTDTTLTSAASRNIYTLGDTGIVNLSSNGWGGSSAILLKSALKLPVEPDMTIAEKRFNWLMGVNEPTLRTRNKLLGDIVNSDPAYAGAASQRHNLLPSSYGASTYNAYLGQKLARKKAVFVGANDGMMHAFDAETGIELFAYIPRGVYSKLAGLTDPNYQHKFTVDGPLQVSDVYIEVGGTKQWRTLVGGPLGAGGRGAYLLDVTDVLAGTGAPRVIFDVHAGDALVPFKDDLGYSEAKMMVVPTKGDRWVAVLNNGAFSNNNTAKLILIDVENPVTGYKVISTSTQTDNGLSGAALLPDGNGLSTYAYAGDLKGNMWKFDLTASAMSSWGLSYSTGAPTPLIKVMDATGAAQPITGTPTLGRNALKPVDGGTSPSVMVYFGTGRYSVVADISTTAVQSIYAIADIGQSINMTALSRNAKLKQKKITAEASGLREVNPDKTPVTTGIPTVDWGSYYGWYLDLSYLSAEGERVITKPLLMFDRLIVNTFIPSPNQCDYGGSGWIMELTGVGDKFIGVNMLFPDGETGEKTPDPILGELVPITAGDTLYLLGSPLSGTAIVKEAPPPPGTKGRLSWRQLK